MASALSKLVSVNSSRKKGRPLCQRSDTHAALVCFGFNCLRIYFYFFILNVASLCLCRCLSVCLSVSVSVCFIPLKVHSVKENVSFLCFVWTIKIDLIWFDLIGTRQGRCGWRLTFRLSSMSTGLCLFEFAREHTFRCGAYGCVSDSEQTRGMSPWS